MHNFYYLSYLGRLFIHLSIIMQVSQHSSIVFICRPQYTICIWRHRRAPTCVGGQTKHCHVGHRQACSQQANPCMPYCRAGRAGPGRALTEGLMRSASTTCARSATSLDPQHGVVVMETWRQCIRSISTSAFKRALDPGRKVIRASLSWCERAHSARGPPPPPIYNANHG